VSEEYRIKISVRNNLILSAIERAGFVGYGMQARFAAFAGMKVTELNALVTMRFLPINEDGEFSAAAKTLMEVLGAAPLDLWTDRQLTMRLKRNTAEMYVDENALRAVLEGVQETMTLPNPEDVVSMGESQKLVAQILDVIPKRNARILRSRFGIGADELSTEEIGRNEGICRARIHQIEGKITRHLNWLSRSAARADLAEWEKKAAAAVVALDDDSGSPVEFQPTSS
jgi:hypothetical protein